MCHVIPTGTWGLGRIALYLHTDITREADLKAAIHVAVREFGWLDCVCNNAGGASSA